MIFFGAYLYRQLARRRAARGKPPSLQPGVPGLGRMLVEELVLRFKRRPRRN